MEKLQVEQEPYNFLGNTDFERGVVVDDLVIWIVTHHLITA